ncbi:hypothetical protein EB001_13480 [bacterium]|nr:hypothetical protein [bacterium]
MSYGIILRVTHAGANVLNSSVYLPDTHDGKDSNGRVQNQRSAQYVPVGGYVDLVFSDQVAFSYQQGGIRGLINEGYISTSFIVNTDFSDAITTVGDLDSILTLTSVVEDAGDGVATSLATSTTYYITGGAETSTLADGVSGQIKILVGNTLPGAMVVTVAHAGWKAGNAAGTITLTPKGDACTLQFVNGAWYCIGNNGCAFA